MTMIKMDSVLGEILKGLTNCCVEKSHCEARIL